MDPALGDGERSMMISTVADADAIIAKLTDAQRAEIMSFTPEWPIRLMTREAADHLPAGVLIIRTDEPERRMRSFRLSHLGLLVQKKLARTGV
jgi:hypothetical protein